MSGGNTSRAAPIVTIASVCVAVLALYAAREFLVPLVFSALVTWVLMPIVRQFEKRGISRTFSVVLVCTLAYGTMAAMAWLAARQLVDVAILASESRASLERRLEEVGLSSLLHLGDAPAPRNGENQPPNHDAGPMPVRIVDPAGEWDLLAALATRVLQPVAVAGFAAIVGVFILLRWEDVRDRLIRLVSHGRIAMTTQALEEMSEGISRVLRAQLLLNFSSGLVIALSLWGLGVPKSLLWGVLAGALRFIPLAGPIIAAAFPTLLALATGEGWMLPGIIIGLFLIIELVVANFIEPVLLGARAGVSTVALLVAAAFWTWIWGLPGLLLATPITVGLAVIGRHVPRLSFLDVLLGERPVLTPAMRLYQRIIALDRVESARLVDQAVTERSAAAAAAELLGPVLAECESVRHAGELETPRVEPVFDLIANLAENLYDRAAGSNAAASPQTDPPGSTGWIWCVPARNDADEAAAMLISVLLLDAGLRTRPLTVAELGDLPSLLADDRRPSQVVCICGAGPQAMRAARLRQRQVEHRRPGTLTRLVMLDPELDGVPQAGATLVAAQPTQSPRAVSLVEAVAAMKAAAAAG